MKPDALISIILALAISLSSIHAQQQDSLRLPAIISTGCPLQDNLLTLRQRVLRRLDEIEITNIRPCSCEGTGWTRVAYLDMSDPRQGCPSNWTLNTSPVRGCGRTSTGSRTCDSVFYPANGLRYSRVCGRITAYHKGWADGFREVTTVEHVIPGVSVTHGPPGARQHVWSFVVAENDVEMLNYNCPCSNTSSTGSYPTIPSFIEDNYFCDTGRHMSSSNETAFYTNDPLWDGEGCASSSSCCKFNSPPWFRKSLRQPTTDDLEIRLCNHFVKSFADKIVTLVDICIQ